MSLNAAERAICAKIAAEITEHPERWTQGRWAADVDGRDTDAHSPAAVCWCAAGFLKREFAGNSYLTLGVVSEIADIVDQSVGEWNDAPGRSAPEVAAVFAKLAEAPQS